MKNIRTFYLKIFIFFKVKFSVYLNRHVFVIYFRNFVNICVSFCLILLLQHYVNDAAAKGQGRMLRNLASSRVEVLRFIFINISDSFLLQLLIRG